MPLRLRIRHDFSAAKRHRRYRQICMGTTGSGSSGARVFYEGIDGASPPIVFLVIATVVRRTTYSEIGVKSVPEQDEPTKTKHAHERTEDIVACGRCTVIIWSPDRVCIWKIITPDESRRLSEAGGKGGERVPSSRSRKITRSEKVATAPLKNETFFKCAFPNPFRNIDAGFQRQGVLIEVINYSLPFACFNPFVARYCRPPVSLAMARYTTPLPLPTVAPTTNSTNNAATPPRQDNEDGTQTFSCNSYACKKRQRIFLRGRSGIPDLILGFF